MLLLVCGFLLGLLLPLSLVARAERVLLARWERACNPPQVGALTETHHQQLPS